MNLEEKLVEEYLKSKGYENLIFEPDGNIPPDFSINGSIAIEVRRLNQHIKNSSDIEPVEKLVFSISSIIDKIVNEIVVDHFERSAFLFVHYSRPLSISRQVKNEIRSILRQHLSNLSQRKIYQIHQNFEIEVFPVENKLETVYKFGGVSDGDTPGFTVGLIYQNLETIIKEKEVKINKYKDRYQEWWLAVVDTIGYGMGTLDIKQFNDLPKIKNDFDKVLLIPPLKPKDGIILIDNMNSTNRKK